MKQFGRDFFHRECANFKSTQKTEDDHIHGHLARIESK